MVYMHKSVGARAKMSLSSLARDYSEASLVPPIIRIQIVFAIRRTLQWMRSSTIYVGDSDHDAQATNAVGGIFVLMNTRKYDARTIDTLSPKAVIHSLTELPNTLRKI